METVEPCFEEPRLRWDKKQEIWVTEDAVCWDCGDGRFIFVPSGYKTNLASVPKIARPVFDTFGAHNRAAIIHDYLYEHRGWIGETQLKLAECDKIFLNIMTYDEVPKWKAQIMYWAVRLNVFNWFKDWR